MTATAILEKLSSQGLDYNKTSVYRALDRMRAEGDVCRQTLGENQIYYELHQDDHDHLVCQHCGRVVGVHAALSVPQEVDTFKVDHHHLTLYGLCSDCQQ